MNHAPIDRSSYERGLALLIASRETIAKIPPRIVERYGVLYCRQCNLTIHYCRCTPAPMIEAKDGGESDLQKRIVEAREQQGGR